MRNLYKVILGIIVIGCLAGAVYLGINYITDSSSLVATYDSVKPDSVSGFSKSINFLKSYTATTGDVSIAQMIGLDDDTIATLIPDTEENEDLDLGPDSYDFAIDNLNITVSGIGSYKIAWVSDLHINVDPSDPTIITDLSDLSTRQTQMCPMFVPGDTSGLYAHQLIQPLINWINDGGFDAVIFGGDMEDYISETNIKYLNALFEGINVPYMWIRTDHDWGGTIGNSSASSLMSASVDGGPSNKVLTLGNELVIYGVNNSTQDMDSGALSAIASYASGTPTLLVTHVPYDSSDSSAASSLNTTIGAVHTNNTYYYWSKNGQTWNLNNASNTLSALSNYVWTSNTSIKYVLAGHTHYSTNGFQYDGPVWDGSLGSGGPNEHIFGAACFGNVGIININGGSGGSYIVDASYGTDSDGNGIADEDEDGDTDFYSIQAAIYNAPSGTTITVKNGTYDPKDSKAVAYATKYPVTGSNGSLTQCATTIVMPDTKSITLVGESKSGVVIQSDCSNYSKNGCFLLLGGTIKNMTIKGYNAASNGSAYTIHADYGASSSKMVIENCDISINAFTCIGIGMYPNQSLSFSNCSISSGVDGVFIHDSTSTADNGMTATVKFTNCNFSGVWAVFTLQNCKAAGSSMNITLTNCSNSGFNCVYTTVESTGANGTFDVNYSGSSSYFYDLEDFYLKSGSGNNISYWNK